MQHAKQIIRQLLLEDIQNTPNYREIIRTDQFGFELPENPNLKELKRAHAIISWHNEKKLTEKAIDDELDKQILREIRHFL